MPTPILGGGLPPGVSKLVNVAKYRHSDFGMSFGTDTLAKMPEFGGGEGGVSKTNVFETQLKEQRTSSYCVQDAWC
jgi:hypothetical protein